MERWDRPKMAAGSEENFQGVERGTVEGYIALRLRWGTWEERMG